MRFIRVKTRAFLPPRDDLFELLDKYLPKLKNGDVVFITSKVLAIHQGRCRSVASVADKERLIKQEAEAYLPAQKYWWGKFILTIKDNTLIPSAGIDESNGNGYYILWPKNVNALLKQIHRHLCWRHKVKKLAVIATDSHVTPLRTGVVGIAIGFYGLEPVRDQRGRKDIFGRQLKHTRINVVDALSAIAVLLMGEGAERTPIVISRNFPGLTFTRRNTYRRFIFPVERDLYYPLLKRFRRPTRRS